MRACRVVLETPNGAQQLLGRRQWSLYHHGDTYQLLVLLRPYFNHNCAPYWSYSAAGGLFIAVLPHYLQKVNQWSNTLARQTNMFP